MNSILTSKEINISKSILRELTDDLPPHYLYIA